MEMSGQLHAPAALPPGKDPWHQLDRWLNGPQSRSGRCGKEKILHCRESNPTPARRSSLCRLFYPDSTYIVSSVVINTMLDVTELFVQYPPTSDTITRCVIASGFIALETSREHSRHIAHCGVFCVLNSSILFPLFPL
jgi:hypothetical protein